VHSPVRNCVWILFTTQRRFRCNIIAIPHLSEQSSEEAALRILSGVAIRDVLLIRNVFFPTARIHGYAPCCSSRSFRGHQGANWARMLDRQSRWNGESRTVMSKYWST